MTDIERIEDRLAVVIGVIAFLETRLHQYHEEEGSLVMDLNRARRLERETKELPDV